MPWSVIRTACYHTYQRQCLQCFHWIWPLPTNPEAPTHIPKVYSLHMQAIYVLFFTLRILMLIYQLSNCTWAKRIKKTNNTAPALPWLLSHLSRSTTFHQVSDPCQVSFVRKVTFPLASRPNKLGWKQFIIQGDYLNRSELSLLCQAPLVSFFPSQI